MAFGWNNIEHEILEEVETKEEASLRERHYILKYRSNEPEFGYNKYTNLYATYEDKDEYKRMVNYTRCKNHHKKIRCVETGEIFDNMTSAGKSIGVSCEAIHKAIEGNRKCKRYHFEKVEA